MTRTFVASNCRRPSLGALAALCAFHESTEEDEPVNGNSRTTTALAFPPGPEKTTGEATFPASTLPTASTMRRVGPTGRAPDGALGSEPAGKP